MGSVSVILDRESTHQVSNRLRRPNQASGKPSVRRQVRYGRRRLYANWRHTQKGLMSTRACCEWPRLESQIRMMLLGRGRGKQGPICSRQAQIDSRLAAHAMATETDEDKSRCEVELGVKGTACFWLAAVVRCAIQLPRRAGLEDGLR